MSVNYDLLRNMYHDRPDPLLPLIEIFVAIAFFIFVPYVFVKFFEHNSEVSETEETDSTKIDDWFAFRKIYQTPK